MYAIFRKEIQSFLDSPIAYIAVGVFLVGMGLFTWLFPESSVLDSGLAEMSPTFVMAPYVYLVLVPAITMRSFAEERRQGTLELLLTRPLSEWSIVLGKFLAAWALVALSLVPTLLYVYTLYELGLPKGNLDGAGIAGSYLGLLLLGGVFASIGLLASAITDSQVVAFIAGLAACFMIHAGFSSIAGINVWGKAGLYVEKLGVAYHYAALSRGLIDSRNVFYLVSVIVACLAGCKACLTKN